MHLKLSCTVKNQLDQNSYTIYKCCKLLFQQLYAILYSFNSDQIVHLPIPLKLILFYLYFSLIKSKVNIIFSVRTNLEHPNYCQTCLSLYLNVELTNTFQCQFFFLDQNPDRISHKFLCYIQHFVGHCG